MRKSLLSTMTGLIVCVVSGSFSMAETYPTKPVRMVVAYAAGGSGDLLARLLGQQLEKRWGQQLVVDIEPEVFLQDFLRARLLL